MKRSYKYPLLALLVFVSTKSFGVGSANQCIQRLVAAGKLPAPFSVSLSANGRDAVIPAESYYLQPGVAGPVARPRFEDLIAVIMGRTPAEQARIDRLLRAGHAETENSFSMSPVAGAVSPIFSPEVHGAVVPIERSFFDRLVQTTAPVMRASRWMLQQYYSHANPTADNLGFEGATDTEKRQIIDIFRSSVYFEPKLRTPEMRSYPFLTIVGFDAAIDTLSTVNGLFFEPNAGTPSGLSNNIQLLETLRLIDPQLYASLMSHLPYDDTFAILRQGLESNARAWTGSEEGISVVLTPGEANAAHPDISYISLFTGLQLVRAQDLYEDEQGFYRLNTGRLGHDPRVTGIYSRMEESFFINSPEHAIPARDPSYVRINERLSQSIGLRLEPGVFYEYLYRNGDPVPIDVARDAQGRPKYQNIFAKISNDPTRPNAPRGNLIRAIHNRKVYISGLGGRVADNKALFYFISRYLAPKFVDGSTPNPIFARPPRTLSQDEYPLFYSAPERYFAKELDKSGANGVHPMVNMPPAERQAIVARVRANPERYTIQEFVSSVALLTPDAPFEGANESQYVYGNRYPDGRIYSVIDAEGNVRAGINSVLWRVAKQRSAISNTSAGGGYGIVAVQQPDAIIRYPQDSILPYHPPHEVLPVDRQADLRLYLNELDQAIRLSDASLGYAPGAAVIEELIRRHRTVMDILGRDLAPLMSDFRRFGEGHITQAELHAKLLHYREILRSGHTVTNYAALPVIQEVLLDQFPDSSISLPRQREFLRDYLWRMGVPLMLKGDSHGGQLPTLLVNKIDVGLLAKLFRHTIGFQLSLQPTHRYDHGYVRVGNILTDRDSPGRRAYGEIHRTGITWFDVEGHTQYRTWDDNRPVVELEATYLVSAEQMAKAQFYHRARRAAIFQMPYTMEAGQLPNRPNTLSTGEHCFTYTYATNLAAQVSGVRAALLRMGIRDPDSFRQEPGVAAALSAIRSVMLNWPVTFDTDTDAPVFSPNALTTMQIPGGVALEVIRNLLPMSASTDTLTLANWLVAFEACLQYQSVLGELGAGQGNRNPVHPGTALVMIFDESPTGVRAISKWDLFRARAQRELDGG